VRGEEVGTLSGQNLEEKGGFNSLSEDSPERVSGCSDLGNV